MKIILAHGILGFGTIDLGKPISYFKGIKPLLEGLGHSVIAPPVNPVGSVEDRAPVLADAIKDFAAVGDEALIIAHSMGGLDARAAIAHDEGVRSRVRTLVTIGTPHFGSPIADLFSVEKKVHDFLGVKLNVLAELEDGTSLHDLTTGAAKPFQIANPDQQGITYHAIAGAGRPGSHVFDLHTSGFFLPSFGLMIARGLANDGMVPADSAARQKPPWDTWPADHADEIGWDLNDPAAEPSREHLARYAGIVTRVEKERAI